MSFFNDDEGPEPPSSTRQAWRGGAGVRPQPRRAQHGGTRHAADRREVMMRRRIAAGVAVVAVILIVVIVSAIVQSQKTSALESYGREVDQIAHESQQQIGKGLFAALVGAGQKEAVTVQEQIYQLHSQAQSTLERASAMGVPGGAVEAQRNLVLALNMRAEGLSKVAGLVRTALGGKAKEASQHLAGDMQIFLASDVIWSMRVVPLANEALAAGGVDRRSVAGSRSLPNLGWLQPETALSRITGQSVAEAGQLAPGTHGHELTGVTVGTTALQGEPALNHIPGGENPTFTVTLQNTGENPEMGVKVDVAVLSGGKTVTASHTIDRTEPGQMVNVDIPVSGVALGVTAKVTVKVAKVPGETNLENNRASYLAVFE